jgi:phenylpyruvate tautomerase PptA (4-oxalocrotonate tautomerase family)
MATLDGMAPDKASTSTRIPQKMSNLPLAKKMRRGHAERKFRPQEPTMPNIIVKIPEGVFGEPARKVLATGIHAAAKAVEQFGDEPMQEFLTWVVIEEVKEGYLFAGGANPLAQFIPVIVFFYPPGGVIDAAGHADTVKRMHEAVANAKPEGDTRLVVTSVMMWDVPEGAWGANGQLWALPDFVRAAGYKHLQHLVRDAA